MLTDHTEEVWHIQFSRNGRWLASASRDASAILWEVIPGHALSKRHTLRGHTKALTFCCWSPDDSMLATCSLDGLVKIWEVETGSCLRTIDLHQGATFTAAWAADGTAFISRTIIQHLWPSAGLFGHRQLSARGLSEDIMGRDAPFQQYSWGSSF